jgi:hypothetical protein
LKLPWWTFFPSTINGVIGFLAVSIGCYYYSIIWGINSWANLIISSMVISMAYAIATYNLGLNNDERHLVKSEVRYRLKTIFRFSG